MLRQTFIRIFIRQTGALRMSKSNDSVLSPCGGSFKRQERGVMCSSSQPDNAALLSCVRSVIPSLTDDKHKGQCGRIAVIGGCQEYTGAPYFAAYSAIKTGVDLGHVFCTEAAAPVIKSYSPELIVHPTLDIPNGEKLVSDWLDRMHAVVIGPGLGRDKNLLLTVQNVVEHVCKDQQRPVVIDADGLFLLSNQPGLVQGQAQVILTPNAAEFSRLCDVSLNDRWKDLNDIDQVLALCNSLGGVTVVRKGRSDIISNGKHVLVCSSEGNARRCGGQGDLLSGSLAAFSYWAQQAVNLQTNNELLTRYGASICAGYGACLLTRECARRAFIVNGRSTTTTDLIKQIHASFEALFGV